MNLEKKIEYLKNIDSFFELKMFKDKFGLYKRIDSNTALFISLDDIHEAKDSDDLNSLYIVAQSEIINFLQKVEINNGALNMAYKDFVCNDYEVIKNRNGNIGNMSKKEIIKELDELGYKYQHALENKL